MEGGGLAMADETHGSALRPLTAAEADLVEQYPLPAGVPDALVNKAQLEVALGVSQVTISAWLRKGLPFEVEGTNGRSYQFRLSLAHAWNCDRLEVERSRDAHAEAAARQMQMALLGDDGLSGAAHLSVAQQRAILELEHVRAVAARDRGELLRRAEVLTGIEEAFAAFRDALDALPDRLAREFGLEGRQLEQAQAICDDVLAGGVAKVRGLIGDGEGGGL